MLERGESAPDFELMNQDGEPVKLSDFAGRNVVLYFYPKAGTPGCTRQARGVRDRGAEYEQADAVVLGVSRDRPEQLLEFAREEGLGFTLLSDPDNEVARLYGIEVQHRTLKSNERSTFVIGPDATIDAVFRTVDPDEHDDLVLGALAAAA